MTARIGLKTYSFVLIAFCLASVVSAQNAAPAAGAAAGAPLNLDRNMSAMARAFRVIKANAADKSKNDATLAAVVQLQTATLAAKAQTPSTIEKLTGEEKTKKLLGYRTMMAKLLQAELTLEQQLLAGENDKAAASVAAIEEIQKAGHKEYQPAE